MNGSARTGATRAAEPEHAGLPTPRRWLAAASISLGTILTTTSGSMITIALPTLARDFQVSPASTVLVVTVYQLVLMMTLLPFSALGDWLGHRTIYQYGQMLFVAATMLSFFANSLGFLVLIRGFQAVGASAAMSVSSALIREIYPASRLGRGLALNTVMAAAFASMAPSIGGAVLAVASWPWMFAGLVPFALLSILLGRKSLPDPVVHRSSFDLPGAVLCAATFGLVVVGLETGLHGDSPVVSAALAALGAAIGVVFVRRERVQPRPMLPVDLLRHRSVALPVIGLFAAYMAAMVVTVNLPFRLQQGYHFSPAMAGAIMAPWPLVALVAAPAAGSLSDRYSAGALGGLGMVIAIGGLIGLALLPAAPGEWDIIWRIMVCGTGFAMFYAPNARQVIGSAPRERMAAAGALTTTTRGAAQTLGATLTALLLSVGLGSGPATLLLAAGLCGCAAACSLVVMRPPARQGGLDEVSGQ